MNKENTINSIINLAKFVMDEANYNKLITYLKMELYGKLRMFIEDILETLETKIILYRENPVLEAQLAKCRRLDALVTDLYVDNLVSSP